MLKPAPDRVHPVVHRQAQQPLKEFHRRTRHNGRWPNY